MERFKRYNKMRWKLLIALIIPLLFISLVSATIVFVSPLDNNGELQPSSTFNYDFNYTTDSSCNNVIRSLSFPSVATNKQGIAAINLNTTDLSQVPSYLCEYKNGVLRKTHTLSDITVRDVYARNVNISGWFRGLFNLIVSQNSTKYLRNNGSELSLNEEALNNTIMDIVNNTLEGCRTFDTSKGLGCVNYTKVANSTTVTMSAVI